MAPCTFSRPLPRVNLVKLSERLGIPFTVPGLLYTIRSPHNFTYSAPKISLRSELFFLLRDVGSRASMLFTDLSSSEPPPNCSHWDKSTRLRQAIPRTATVHQCVSPRCISQLGAVFSLSCGEGLSELVIEWLRVVECFTFWE